MAKFSKITDKVRIQYPILEPQSLQRSITQIKDLLESDDFYLAISENVGEVTIQLLAGGTSPLQGPPGNPGPAGEGVPPGGSAGQILAKINGTDYNTEWVDDAVGIPEAPVDGTVYARQNSTWVAASTGGGGDFLPAADEVDDTDATYFYFGWTDASTGSGWLVRRQLRSDASTTNANVANNGSYGTLAAAWLDRLLLTYA